MIQFEQQLLSLAISCLENEMNEEYLELRNIIKAVSILRHHLDAGEICKITSELKDVVFAVQNKVEARLAGKELCGNSRKI